jgi:hypothetical protein
MSDPFTCPYCGHTAPVDGNPGDQILRCDECATVLAYGLPMPLMAVRPHPEDVRFVTLTIESRDANKPARVQITVERGCGSALAEKLLAVCRPPVKAPGLAPDAGATVGT